MEQTSAEMVDRVCGAKIDPEAEAYSVLYQGRTYYFCCLNCQLDFQEAPERYLTTPE